MSHLQSVDANAYDEDGRRVSGSGEQHGGQVRMAFRLAQSHRDRLLFVHGVGWYWWTGTHWAEDDSGHARRAVLDVLAVALAESLSDKQLRADVAKCETASGIDGVLAIASALIEFAATVRDLDADPLLLNTASGILDLRTMELGEHDPAARLSKITAGAYRPDADPGEWSSFLATVLPDAQVRGYLQRLIGQALVGRTVEHVFPIATGVGANGKSVATEAIRFALGGYAVPINPDLLLTSDRGPGGTELMELMGARLAIGQETNDGRSLDEALMKRLCGGDELTARRLYRDPVSWSPTHSLLYVTNALPKVSGDSPAVWRRIRVLPFSVVIAPEDRDPHLTERLRLHTDAVLTWAIEGYRAYAEHGMQEPDAVKVATQGYQSDSDAVARFITDACHVASTAAATTRELYAAWQRWAIEDGADPMPERAFGKDLDRLGYPAKRTKRGATRAGLMPLDGSESMGGDAW